MSQVRIEVEVRIMQVPAGGGTAMAQPAQGNNPGIGPLQTIGAIGNAQMKFYNDATMVPGTAGSVTLADFLTAFDQIANDFAAASGDVILTDAELAQINGWQTGGV